MTIQVKVLECIQFAFSTKVDSSHWDAWLWKCESPARH